MSKQDTESMLESIAKTFQRAKGLRDKIVGQKTALQAARDETATARKNLRAADDTGNRALREKSFDLIAAWLEKEKNIIAGLGELDAEFQDLQEQRNVLRKEQYPMLVKQDELLRQAYEESLKLTREIESKLLSLAMFLNECYADITKLNDSAAKPAKPGEQAEQTQAEAQESEV